MTLARARPSWRVCSFKNYWRAAKVGYDIESTVAPDKPLRFLEVKGRVVGADTVTVTRNEILTALNAPDQFILAVVEVEDGAAKNTWYMAKPFEKEPDFHATSVNYALDKLLCNATLQKIDISIALATSER